MGDGGRGVFFGVRGEPETGKRKNGMDVISPMCNTLSL